MKLKLFLLLTVCMTLFSACVSEINNDIKYCAAQAEKTLCIQPSLDQIPNSVYSGESTWHYCSPGGWTCGFWSGDLWYLYEGTGDEKWKDVAIAATEQIIPVAYSKAKSHDVGFMIMTSIGNAYRLTGDSKYKYAMLSAADSLAKLYNPNVGTILSWPGMVQKMDWPHNTIIDNMMNLELLFWVAENCNRPDLYDIAFKHSETTMEHQFRDDYSTYHVAVYDPEDGHFISGHTHQGWKDESTWSRGQAWAIYGFTMAYRFTKDYRFLETATKAADAFLNRLPDDLVPYWDFDAGVQLTDQPKDCSASAITASALLELQSYVPKEQKGKYLKTAKRMIREMSKAPYRAGDQCSAFILHCTGNKPAGSEIDASISYGDYYYLEALIRLKFLGSKSK